MGLVMPSALTVTVKLFPPVMAALNVPLQAEPVRVISAVPTVLGANDACVPSTRAIWHSLAIDERSAFAEESLALLAWLRNAGNAIDARMPIITITTSSSIRVNPRLMDD